LFLHLWQLKSASHTVDTLSPAEFPEDVTHVFSLSCESSNCPGWNLAGFVLTYGVQRTPSLEPVMVGASRPVVEFEYPDLFCQGAPKPVMSDISMSKVGVRTAEIQWTTDRLTTGEVRYVARASETPKLVQDVYYGITHTLTLTDITGCDTQFTVTSTDRCRQVSSESREFDVCDTTLYLPLVRRGTPAQSSN
jgi:hypothetical protein